MKRSLLVSLLPILILGYTLATGENQATARSLPVSDFAVALEPGKRILEEEGWMNWCMAPIYDDKGQLHLYYCRWTAAKKSAWLESAQIVHATAPRPEGPYTNKTVILGDENYSYYNPQINKMGDTYVLVYAYISPEEKDKKRQQVGIATAKSPDGPWVQSPYNPIIAPETGSGEGALVHASNPTFMQAPDGTYRVYFKSMFNDHEPPMLRTISLACSDKIEGPYKLDSRNPLIDYTDKRVDMEDPYVFHYKNKYFLIVEDRQNIADAILYDKIPEDREAGGWRPGLIYESEDGIDWGIPQIGYQQNSYYFDEETRRFERPHILWKNGEPEYIFFALDGGKFDASSGAILKVGEW
jgi:hypothetical protein